MKSIGLLLICLLLGQVVHGSIEYEAEEEVMDERKPATFVDGEYEYEDEYLNKEMKAINSVMASSSGGDPRSNEVCLPTRQGKI